MQIKLKPQNRFPYLEEYRKRFPINKDTIFVYKDTIYTDKKEDEFYYDVVHHELEHIRSQKEQGADNWIMRYLEEPEFRLQEELRAYRHQLEKVKETGDRAEYMNIYDECANNLSSSLYGKMVTKKKALELLKIE